MAKIALLASERTRVENETGKLAADGVAVDTVHLLKANIYYRG
jgi:hypothetical protein